MEAKDEKKKEEELPKYTVEEIDAKVNYPNFFADFNAVLFGVNIQISWLNWITKIQRFLGTGKEIAIYDTRVSIGSFVINSC